MQWIFKYGFKSVKFSAVEKFRITNHLKTSLKASKYIFVRPIPIPLSDLQLAEDRFKLIHIINIGQYIPVDIIWLPKIDRFESISVVLDFGKGLSSLPLVLFGRLGAITTEERLKFQDEQWNKIPELKSLQNIRDSISGSTFLDL